jgi:3-hydroxyethyl bacteriochlorophyllide a dehydrogenase
MLNALAIVLEQPEHLSLARLDLTPPGSQDVVVRTLWSGVSTGTERLLFNGRMPVFPGMGYPLVPGYETVGTIVHAGADTLYREGQTVFVPGSRCFGPVRGLFGGAASQLVSAASRIIEVPESLGERAILLALAATALHARAGKPKSGRELIVGHGVLGRLLARISVLEGGEPPVVWERNSVRQSGADGYEVTSPEEDPRKDYQTIFDVSGDSGLLDSLIARLSHGGEIVLAGFYDKPLSFAFPPAFMRETRIRVAAEWREPDLVAVKAMIESGALSLNGLITHREPATNAAAAYPTAFEDPACLKMVLDWRTCQ